MHDIVVGRDLRGRALSPRRLLARGLLAPLAALALQGTALAAAGDLLTTVERLQSSVTYSDPSTTPPLATFVGYRVTVANVGGNTINNIRFTGGSSVTEPAETAVLASVDGATCTVSPAGTAIDCALGQLRAGEAAPSFAVFFRAPARAAGSAVPPGVDGSCTSTDCVAFSGITYYGEGTGGINSVPDNSISEWGPVYVALGTDNPVLVRSAVQKAGGSLFTGKGGLTTAADPFSTSVSVPAGATFTTAQIQEAAITGGCSVLPTCFTSTLTIPGTFSPYLGVVLRLDAAAIPNGTKIGSILISYDGTLVGDCASPTTPTGTGIPCVAARRAYPKNSRSGLLFPVDLEGDFEWTLINTRNGSIKIF